MNFIATTTYEEESKSKLNMAIKSQNHVVDVVLQICYALLLEVPVRAGPSA
jgi:hypothetical protein